MIEPDERNYYMQPSDNIQHLFDFVDSFIDDENVWRTALVARSVVWITL